MQRPFITKALQAIVFLLLLLPMLFLNVRGSHFWGDDFSVYIQQAINISQGKPFDASGYQYIPGFSSLVPVAPVGFSLMLAPLVKACGVNMLYLSIYLSVFFIAWMAASFLFFRRYFGVTTCLVILLAAFYANFMLWMKLQVTSDVPFSVLFVIACLVLSRPNITVRTFIVAGIITGFAVITRSVGIVIVPATWLYFGFRWWRDKARAEAKMPWKGLLLFSFLVFGVYGLSDWVLFRSQHSYVSETLSTWDITAAPATIWFNLRHYTQNYLDLFKSSDPELAIYSTIIGFVFLGLTGLGFIYKVSKKTEIFDFIFLCYLLVIFLFSFVSDYRYIVPIHIFLMLYLFTGLKYLAAKLRLRQTTIAQLIFVALILFMYSDHLHYIWTTRNDILEGPYEPISQETFAYLRTHIPDDQIIVFNKARTLALYTGKKTTIHNFNATSSENYRRLHAMGARYYLLNPKVDDFNYVALIRYKQKDFKPIYQNWQFTLFEDTTAIR